MRQIADLLTMLQDYHELAPNLPRVLEISFEESTKLQVGYSADYQLSEV
jgi:E3 ubiquitin-protein ligase EDD1